jgi:hypothetical protein
MKVALAITISAFTYLIGYNSGFNTAYDLVVTQGIQLHLITCPEAKSCEYNPPNN